MGVPRGTAHDNTQCVLWFEWMGFLAQDPSLCHFLTPFHQLMKHFLRGVLRQRPVSRSLVPYLVLCTQVKAPFEPLDQVPLNLSTKTPQTLVIPSAYLCTTESNPRGCPCLHSACHTGLVRLFLRSISHLGWIPQRASKRIPPEEFHPLRLCREE